MYLADISLTTNDFSIKKHPGLSVDCIIATQSILKTGKAKAVRLSTLEAICEYLSCQPGDLLEFK